MKRAHIFVSGYVQGVFFRRYTVKQASKLSLKGWVRNLSDKRVEIVAEGPEKYLKEFISALEKGSIGSKVENLDVSWDAYTGEFSNFERRASV